MTSKARAGRNQKASLSLYPAILASRETLRERNMNISTKVEMESNRFITHSENVPLFLVAGGAKNRAEKESVLRFRGKDWIWEPFELAQKSKINCHFKLYRLWSLLGFFLGEPASLKIVSCLFSSAL